MAAPADDDFRKFIRVSDPKERASLLSEAEHTFASVMIWTKNQQRSLDTRLVKLIQPPEKKAASDPYGPHLYCWIPDGFDAKEFGEYLEHILSPDCYFSLSLARANVFFKARYIEANAGGLKFELPKELYKVQRREDQRHQIPDGHTLKVQFSDPQFPERTQSRRIIDLSAGGLSFIVPDAEHAMFVGGLTLKDLTFTIKGRTITATAEIKHKRSTPLHLVDTLLAGTRIGVQFVQMTESDRQWVRAWVLEETRKLVSKFLA
jgi:hypothetical protein